MCLAIALYVLTATFGVLWRIFIAFGIFLLIIIGITIDFLYTIFLMLVRYASGANRSLLSIIQSNQSSANFHQNAVNVDGTSSEYRTYSPHPDFEEIESDGRIQ